MSCMKHGTRPFLILVTVALGACGASTTSVGARSPADAADALMHSDPRLARVGPGDCAGSRPWREFRAQVQIEKQDSRLCITSRRPVVGRPDAAAIMKLKMRDGDVIGLQNTDAWDGKLFGYCRLAGDIRPVWIQTQTGCTSEETPAVAISRLAFHDEADDR